MPQYTYAVPTINTSYEEPYRYDESQYAYLPHQAEFIRATKDVDRVMKILKGNIEVSIAKHSVEAWTIN